MERKCELFEKFFINTRVNAGSSGMFRYDPDNHRLIEEWQKTQEAHARVKDHVFRFSFWYCSPLADFGCRVQQSKPTNFTQVPRQTYRSLTTGFE